MSMKMKKIKSLLQYCDLHMTTLSDDSGMASILVTLVTLVVVTLIVLGFATITHREQGNTTDSQLSTQAFYAAETAVNDARQVVDIAAQDNFPIPAKTDCTTNSDTSSSYSYSPNYPIPTPGDAGVMIDDPTHNVNNVSYTCLIVNPSPGDIIENDVGDNSVVVPITSSSTSVNFDTITIQWSPHTKATGLPSAQCPATLGDFSAATPGIGGWNCGYGVLRMDEVPTDAATFAGGVNGGVLESKQLTAFFEPLNTAGSPTPLNYIGAVGKANVRSANCDVVAYTNCTATITIPATNSVVLRLNSLYQPSDLKITATDSTTGQIVTTSSQVEVDATGNANGVLRRIDVRFSINNNSGMIPRYALQSNNEICKRFLVSDGTPAGSGYYANAGDVKSSQTDTSSPYYNAMCDNTIQSGNP
jgi:type II secretory pathway pseudopilin PulG